MVERVRSRLTGLEMPSPLQAPRAQAVSVSSDVRVRCLARLVFLLCPLSKWKQTEWSFSIQWGCPASWAWARNSGKESETWSLTLGSEQLRGGEKTSHSDPALCRHKCTDTDAPAPCPSLKAWLSSPPPWTTQNGSPCCWLLSSPVPQHFWPGESPPGWSAVHSMAPSSFVLPIIFDKPQIAHLHWHSRPFFGGELCLVACGIFVPLPGIKPGQWKRGVLTIGPPGHSQKIRFVNHGAEQNTITGVLGILNKQWFFPSSIFFKSVSQRI